MFPPRIQSTIYLSTTTSPLCNHNMQWNRLENHFGFVYKVRYPNHLIPPTSDNVQLTSQQLNLFVSPAIIIKQQTPSSPSTNILSTPLWPRNSRTTHLVVQDSFIKHTPHHVQLDVQIDSTIEHYSFAVIYRSNALPPNNSLWGL